MEGKEIKEGKYLYHITRLENLESILKNGLLSRKDLELKGIKYPDMANPEILRKRSYSDLYEFIPFHFHPYTAYDKYIKTNFGNENLIYICIHRNFAKKQNFKICPRHPLNINDLEKIYDYEEGFNKIEWDAMGYSENYTNHNKEVNMAECLVNSPLDISSCIFIIVKTKKIRELVEKKLQEFNIDRSYLKIQVNYNIF